MRIGIDISQIAYEGTGVGEYTLNLVKNLLKINDENEYILFYTHLKRKLRKYEIKKLKQNRVVIRQFRIPIPILELLWNRLHILPIEWLIGDIDVFFSSDWVEPPTKKAKKVTTIHDLSVLKHPETFDKKIVAVHRRKLLLAKKYCDMIICDSESTKKDCINLLKIPENKLTVVYPGIIQ